MKVDLHTHYPMHLLAGEPDAVTLVTSEDGTDALRVLQYCFAS